MLGPETRRMTQPPAASASRPHVSPELHDKPLGFWRKYVFSTDHKMIARQFLFLGLFMMILGGLLALIVRWELAWPETPVPGLGPILTETNGILEPSTYNMAFTMHATIMIFFVVMPILVGAFGNFLIPLMIGTRDMAFPVLNMLSFWIAAVGRTFRMLSPLSFPSYVSQRFAPSSIDPEAQSLGENRWGVALAFRDAA